MSRGLTSGIVAQLGAAVVHPALFFEGDFNGTMLRLWTGIGSVTWNGNTWTGVGTLAGISSIQETTKFESKSVTVSLAGVPSSNVSLVLGSAKQGRAATIYIGLLDSSGAIIADPYQAFKGWLDVPTIDDAGETATISITYESRSLMLERAQGRRFTHEDQQIDYPGDLGLAYVATLQDKIISWGNATSGPQSAASAPVPVSASDTMGGGP